MPHLYVSYDTTACVLFIIPYCEIPRCKDNARMGGKNEYLPSSPFVHVVWGLIDQFLDLNLPAYLIFLVIIKQFRFREQQIRESMFTTIMNGTDYTVS